MTATLTDDDRETIRWFAEECLGLEYRGVDVHGNPYWHVRGESYRDTYNLLGWPGFGRVVEYGLAQPGIHSIEPRFSTKGCYIEVWGEFGVIGRAKHTVPAIAGMLALRQAVDTQ